jgi:hypothetical protein
MSYDLMVFDPKAPPSNRSGFMKWYAQQTQWGEGHHYDNPEVSTPELRAWFLDMIVHYPPLNGPYASEDVDSPKVTDYCVGRSVIYAAFSWSEAEEAFRTMARLAEQHRVGFFNVSADYGGVWMPGSDGQYLCVHGQGAHRRKWWQFWKPPPH